MQGAYEMPDVRVSQAQGLLEAAVEAIGRGEWLEAAFTARKAADVCDELREVEFRHRDYRLPRPPATFGVSAGEAPAAPRVRED